MSTDFFADADEAAAAAADEHEAAPLGETASPGVPMAVAEDLMEEWRRNGSAPTLLHYRGTWMRWHGPHWAEVDDREIRAELYRRLQNATYTTQKPQKGADGKAVVDESGKAEMEDVTKQWAPNKSKIANLSEALAAIVHLSGAVDAPSWITSNRRPTGQDSALVACTNGLLRLSDRTMRDHDPRFFNLVSVPFAYQVDAPEPARWLEFLHQLWPDDEKSVEALQEWFGYVLSGRTDLHKIMLIIGPARSGKGTIGRILTALVGKGNMAGPTLASMATNFGLSPLLGKPLAVVSDARLSGRDGQQVVERLLTISGEDTIDVDRKYRDPWTGRLPTRFLILSNELPHFGDASGAIATRFLVLTMNRSFLGQEVTTLTDELMTELPGILNWALDGLARLMGNGRITVPGSSEDAVTSMQDMASPVSAFVRECCEKGADHAVPVDELWREWKEWCEDNGRAAGNRATFGRNLASVVPQLRRTRPRDGQGRQVPTYAGLRIAKTTHNGEAPDSPVSHQVKEDAPPDSGPDSGGGAAPVRRAETGETGLSQLWGDQQQGDRPKTPCSHCGAPHWNADGSPYCHNCRTGAAA